MHSFLHKSVLHCSSVLTFCVCDFFDKRKSGKKAAHKMLLKLTTQVERRQRALFTPTSLIQDVGGVVDQSQVAELKPDTLPSNAAVVHKPTKEKSGALKLPKHTTHQIGVRQ